MKHPLIRKIYLYLFSLIGLALVVIGCVELVNLALKAYVFTAADKNYAYPMAAPAVPSEKGVLGAPAGPSEVEMDAYNQKQLQSGRERDAAGALAYIIVGLPLYLYHWKLIKGEKENDA